jgi:hypothetical protein
MKQHRASLFLLLLASFVSPLAAQPASVSAKAMRAEISSSGAAPVLQKYYDTPAWLHSVMPGIRSAAPAWLVVAEQLAPAADGAAGEDLGLALYDGLAVAPFRVLPVLSRIYGGTVEELCNVSFEAEVPKQGVLGYFASVQSRLRAASTAQERAVAASCRRGLERSLQEAKAQGLT